ncbi:MAG TPA: histidinol-phosphate transaminase [Candidatus Aquilonibacter sp.]|nr:histidinol-phosphate transaminase [Candidatus Aquilonibacter sp.]
MTAFQISRRDFSFAFGGSLAVAASAFSQRHSIDLSTPEAPGTIRINFNENPYGPSPMALAALSTCGHIASRYPDRSAATLTASIAKLHGVQPENIALGCGSTEILHVVDLTFVGPGKNVVVAEPTFEAVLEYAQALHANPVKVPHTADYRHDLPRMAAQCTSKTGVVYVCNPNNPTGTVVSRREIAEFLPQIPPTTLVLVDEAYHHFVEDPAYQTSVDLIPQYPNLVVARTFSKIYGLAGMRLGYAVGSKEIIAQISPELLIANGNAAVLAAAAASLADQASVAATRAKLNATRAWLCEEMKKDGRAYIPSQANFVMIDMGVDVKPIVAKFKEQKILVGRPFPAMPTFLRVTIGTQPEMKSFVAALRQIVPASASRAA